MCLLVFTVQLVFEGDGLTESEQLMSACSEQQMALFEVL